MKKSLIALAILSITCFAGCTTEVPTAVQGRLKITDAKVVDKYSYTNGGRIPTTSYIVKVYASGNVYELELNDVQEYNSYSEGQKIKVALQTG